MPRVLDPRALDPAKIKEIQRLRYEEGLSLRLAAEAAGVSHWAVQKYAPGDVGARPSPGEIEVTALQRAFDASGLTLSDLARRLGWIEPCPRQKHLMRAQTSRVRRTMGRASQTTGPGTRGGRRTYIRRMVGYETAIKFIQACGFDPVDFDL